MAIGTTAAIIGGAALSAGGSALAASKNKKAINRATDAQTQGNAQSLAEQRRQFDIASNNLNPFIRSGTGANSMINALLGIPMQAENTGGTQGNFVGVNAFNQPNAYGGASTFADGGYSVPNYFDSMGTFATPGYGVGAPGMMVENQPQAAQADPRKAANDAFEVFRNSTGYQFRVNEGQDAINTGFAARGLLQSGAALRSLEDYRQNTASAEFGNYLGALQGQQNIGFGAASAQAGVGQSFANNVTQLNTANSNALANAAVARANNSNALIGGISGAIGGALGGLGGSSYGSAFGPQTGISFNPNNARNIMALGG